MLQAVHDETELETDMKRREFLGFAGGAGWDHAAG